VTCPRGRRVAASVCLPPRGHLPRVSLHEAARAAASAGATARVPPLGAAPRYAARVGRSVSDVEIGRAKRARRVYASMTSQSVPSRRTRDPRDVSVNWGIDAYQFSIPFIAAPMDSAVSPATATDG
jgi:hypothetical protein